MNLREFASNSQEVMNAIPGEDKADSQYLKVLGIRWDLKTDECRLSCSLPESSIVTKRTVTSEIAAVYDPLGWLVPLLHRAKVFLQQLWKDQYDWDTHLSAERANEWNLIRSQTQGFQKGLPRFLAPRTSEGMLVSFADASTTGMAACIYLVCPIRRESHLLMAKSKLPSIKGQTTIQLELNAITLAMRLSNAVLSQLEKVLAIHAIYAFTDSEIALSWIRRKPQKDAGVFVLNRLAEIQRIAHHLLNRACLVKFGYVVTGDNPADCGTRGLTAEELENHYWWEGPWFLRKDETEWPSRDKIFDAPRDDNGESIEELSNPMPSSALITSVTPISEDSRNATELLRPSQVKTFTQAKRILAQVLRFISAVLRQLNKKREVKLQVSILKIPNPARDSKFLQGKELEFAGQILIKHHQKTMVNNNILKSLKQLNIVTDAEGILRCRGRLGHAQLDSEAKFPILVLQKTLLSEIIIRDVHDRGHPGVSHTMALIRQKFWIPQLRSQVASIVRKCVLCQKLNNLAYQYPTQEDLPKERVVRSRPFSNVGLDYFGPLAISLSKGNHGKCFGSIITCMVTRLVHLDVVSDLSTTAFLQMLRRFFARRGIPKLIVSDNAPTFLLGESILRECIQTAQSDPLVLKEVSNREIEWRRITPYAPWQGGFYERLIKSIKHSLYKTLGQAVVTLDEMSTTIESIINTRPLTYVGKDLEHIGTLRPIDFLQRELDIEFPLLNLAEDKDDPSYAPSAEIPSLLTRQQTIAALKTSCKLTERFWQLWEYQYLTSLREKHTLTFSRKRGCVRSPKEGQLVLLSDPIIPRQAWKLGMIDEVVRNSKGTIREARVRLPSKKVIRRPINLLVPLELEDEESSKEDETRDLQDVGNQKGISTPGEEENMEQIEPPPRYNLRKRERVNYQEEGNGSFSSVFLVTSILQFIVVGLLMSSATAMTVADHNSSLAIRTMTCIEMGVQLRLPERFPYEVCAEHYCVELKQPQENETIFFSSGIILHEHKVRWKISLPHSIETLESSCSPAPFCPSIDCTFCSANILNPECWPVSAIIATAILLYCVITGCYVFLYVPVTIGKPIRQLVRILWALVKFMFSNTITRRRSGSRFSFRRRRLAEILAIVAIVPAVLGCQKVNVFNHYSTICTEGAAEPCRIQLSEVFKINTFKREACIRLMNNSTLLHEIRLTWKSLYLLCEPETEFFTRDTVHKVISSKHCPHMGTCKGEKCGAINSSSLVPELEQGNHLPGNTACVESCGGPGCDCGFLSSGCLFYRVYMEPMSDKVYEIFHCNRWMEGAKVQIVHFERARRKVSTITEQLIPNIPRTWKFFTFTLTSLSFPAMRILHSRFIADSARTALWRDNAEPPLRCSTSEEARNLSCPVVDNCICLSAETKINCKCQDVPIGSWFNNLRNQLPVNIPSISFQQHNRARVKAKVSSMVTSEIIMNFEGSLESEIIVEDASCRAEATELVGCYNCMKGALTQVTCYSLQNDIHAEVLCDQIGFTIPCNITGITSTLRFSPTKARAFFECTIACGKVATSFKVGGILKFTASLHGMLEKWVKGESTSNSEFVWPDSLHIGTVFLTWYKTLIFTIVGLLLAIAISYMFITTCRMTLIVKLILAIPKLIIKILFNMVKKLGIMNNTNHNKQL